MTSLKSLHRKISVVYTVKKQSRPRFPKMTNGIILPPNKWVLHDPFLICTEDWFHYPGGFDFHPHRGFEIITLVFDGLLRHQDSKGNCGVIGPSRGLLHREVPANKETQIHLMQLWLNLPKSNKFDEATYQDLSSDKIPTRIIKSLNGEETLAKIRVISGKSGDITGPAKNVVPIKALDITIKKQGFTLEEDIPSNYNMFAFVLEGRGTFGFNEQILGGGNVLISPPVLDDENTASVLPIRNDSEEDLRVFLFSGKQIKEPVVQHGPFVGNEWGDILKAKQDFVLGKFAGL
ncbi:10599_t:CDS:2 [Ambispora gerdemannii]|uniref:10599_t:CDS:1 n=1 Tax=Ambispora gerdemannii TaxID=144530 RepID=A0A9N9GI83_9GLOM|nr:10599_t:CDS:2 [Ambispora gerdemannii]